MKTFEKKRSVWYVKRMLVQMVKQKEKESQ